MGLDLTDRVPEELRTEVCGIVLEVVMKILPKKKECKSRQSRNTWGSQANLALEYGMKQGKG